MKPSLSRLITSSYFCGLRVCLAWIHWLCDYLRTLRKATPLIRLSGDARFRLILDSQLHDYGCDSIHSRASLWASAICSGVICLATMSRFSLASSNPFAPARLYHLCAWT